jgi:Uma2 family endonuclease
VDPARKLATWDDLLGLPKDVRAEVVAGVVVTPPAPLPRHARAQRALGRFVGGPFDDDDGRGGPGGWWILLEVDVRLGPNDIVRPDLAGWLRHRLQEPWDVRPIDVVPDWIGEVLSRSNAAHDRVRKRELYARAGVPYYWIIDPDAHTLEALRLDPATRTWIEVGAYGDASTARIAPFEAIELEVQRLFPPPANEPSAPA